MRYLKILCLFLLIFPLMVGQSFAYDDDFLKDAFGDHSNMITIGGSEKGPSVGQGEQLAGSFVWGYQVQQPDGTTWGTNYNEGHKDADALEAKLKSEGKNYRVVWREENGVNIVCDNDWSVVLISYKDYIITKPDPDPDPIIDPDPPTPGEECTDTPDYCDCSTPLDQGTPIRGSETTRLQPGYINPNSENEPFVKGSSFSIKNIVQHFDTEWENYPTDMESYCTLPEYYMECSLNKAEHEFWSGSRCNKHHEWTVWGAPYYWDKYYSVTLTFKGFRVGEDRSNFDTVGTTGETTKSTGGSTLDIEDLTHSPGYIITETIDSELEETESGLFKGWVIINCDCGVCKEELPIYFKITDPDPGEELYPLELKTFTISEDESELNVGRVSINSGAFDETVSEKFKVDDRPNIGAKILDEYENKYEFKGWYEPNEDYYKVKKDWYKNANVYLTSKSTSINMPESKYTLIALFGPVEPYRVRVETDGHGTVKIGDKEREDITVRVYPGETIKIKANPYKDDTCEYELKKWEEIVDGVHELINSTDEELSFTVNKNYHIYVSFECECETGYKLTVEVAGGKYDDDGTLRGYTYPEGTMDAVPGHTYNIAAYTNEDAGYYFYSWSARYVTRDGEEKYVEDSALGQEDSFTMPAADLTLSANITRGDFSTRQVTVLSAGGGWVAINDGEFSLEESVTVGGDATTIIKANPDKDCEFLYWIDESGNYIWKYECSYDGENYIYEVSESGDKVYVAYFQYLGPGFKLTVKSDEGGAAWETIDNARAGEFYAIYSSPDDGWVFDYWEDDERYDIGSGQIEWIEMPARDYTVIAHFKENIIPEILDCELIVEKIGNGTGTVIPLGTSVYPYGTEIELKAYPDAGSTFEGWYEDNVCISKNKEHTIIMHQDRHIYANILKIGDDSHDKITAFKVISIRDLAWKDYFVNVNTELNNHLNIPPNSTANTVLVNSAQLVGRQAERRVKFGYAVECELETWDVECGDVGDTGEISKAEMLSDTTGLYVSVSILGKLSSSELGEYGVISSKSENSIDKFMITATKSYKTDVVGGISIKRPVIKWRWVYYLPLDLEIDGAEVIDDSFTDDLTVKFDIQVKVNNNITYSYNKARKITEGGNWGGNVFTYRTDETLLDDIDNDAIN